MLILTGDVVFQRKMTGAAYGRYHDDEMDYMEAGEAGGDYSSDSDAGNMLSGGEETDDASETESYNHQEYTQYTELKEQMYQDKLSHLKKQLQQLSEGTHPEWLKRTRKLDMGLKERLFVNTVIRDLELDLAEQDRKSTRLNSSHSQQSRMPSSA